MVSLNSNITQSQRKTAIEAIAALVLASFDCSTYSSVTGISLGKSIGEIIIYYLPRLLIYIRDFPSTHHPPTTTDRQAKLIVHHRGWVNVCFILGGCFGRPFGGFRSITSSGGDSPSLLPQQYPQWKKAANLNDDDGNIALFPRHLSSYIDGIKCVRNEAYLVLSPNQQKPT